MKTLVGLIILGMAFTMAIAALEINAVMECKKYGYDRARFDNKLSIFCRKFSDEMPLIELEQQGDQDNG